MCETNPTLLLFLSITVSGFSLQLARVDRDSRRDSIQRTRAGLFWVPVVPVS